MRHDDEYPALVILGPTASGKTHLAVRLAHRLSGEIISADSRQVFRDMDIGTGKDLSEYHYAGRSIPYHLINIREAGERYHLNAFKEDFHRAYHDIRLRGHLPIICGGTGLYIHSIFQNYQYTSIPVNEKLRQTLSQKDITDLRMILQSYPADKIKHADQSSHKRLIRAIEIAEFLGHNPLPSSPSIGIPAFVVGLNSTVERRRNRIVERLDRRLRNGMIEEVELLLSRGVPRDMMMFYGLEYKFITTFLFNEISYDELFAKLSIAIFQFAKRQMTFFRKMEKDGIKIHWFDIDDDGAELTDKILNRYKTSG